MKILFISLGCDKNLVDTEKMLGILQKDGHSFTDEEAKADVIVVNTCCFIGDAKEESINTILEMAAYKENGNLKALIVSGCLAQRYQDEILKEIPEVDAVLGTASYEQISQVLNDVLAKQSEQITCFQDINVLPKESGSRLITTGGYYAFLKIAEGCDKHCTYCIIPSLRGAFRSVPMAELVREAKELAARGVRELILVAQETTLYGVDLSGQKQLPTLLEQLCEIPGIEWIRLQYCYPEEITDELIQVIKTQEKVCHYLDLPIQHASDDILTRMGRRTSKAQLTRLIQKLRREIPDIVLRTTLISGFPGETPENHQELLAFVREMKFDRLGVFPYSREEDTPAAKMPRQVPRQIKEDRKDEIMRLQQEIAFAKSQAKVGQVFAVMIEGEVMDAGEEEHVYVGRTYMDSPNVDGYVFVHTQIMLMSGDFVNVEITGSADYDLIGEIYDESAK